jgi:hypothetical protein
MASGVKVFGRVFVRGRVAAADVPAGHAETQVNPDSADAQAVFTSIRTRRYFFDLIEVCAFHIQSPSRLQNDRIIFHFSLIIKGVESTNFGWVFSIKTPD